MTDAISESPMKKPLLAADAAKLLEREFARLRPVECDACKAPTPFWGPGVANGDGYWYLKMIPPCPHHCERVLTRIWAGITGEYQIERTANDIGRVRVRGALGGATEGTPKRSRSRKLRAR